MRGKRRWNALLLGATLCATAVGVAVAAEPAASPAAAKPAPVTQPADDDLELLEFLGSIDADNEDSDWLDFLRSTDIGKVAKAKTPATASTGKGKASNGK